MIHTSVMVCQARTAKIGLYTDGDMKVSGFYGTRD